MNGTERKISHKEHQDTKQGKGSKTASARKGEGCNGAASVEQRISHKVQGETKEANGFRAGKSVSGRRGEVRSCGGRVSRLRGGWFAGGSG